MGLFWADGHWGFHDDGKLKWSISNVNKAYLEKAKFFLERLYFSIEFRILKGPRPTLSGHAQLWVLHARGELAVLGPLIIKYRSLFYASFARKAEKICPPEILNNTVQVHYEFMVGYYSGDGYKKNTETAFTFNGTTGVGIHGLYVLSRSLDYQVSFNTEVKTKRSEMS